MDRDRPSQFQRILLERAEQFFLDLFCLRVEGVANVLPFGRGHRNVRGFVLAADDDFPITELLNRSYLSIEETLLWRRVVLHEHHLGALLKQKSLVRGISDFWEIALHSGVKSADWLPEGFELSAVEVRRRCVVRRQGDVTVFRWRRRTRTVAFV